MFTAQKMHNFLCRGHKILHLPWSQTCHNRLKQRITDGIAAVTPQMLKNISHNLIKRCRLCIDTNGSHFQHALYVFSTFVCGFLYWVPNLVRHSVYARVGGSTETVTFQAYEILKIYHEFLQIF